jgi:hypothetical protein
MTTKTTPQPFENAAQSLPMEIEPTSAADEMSYLTRLYIPHLELLLKEAKDRLAQLCQNRT